MVDFLNFDLFGGTYKCFAEMRTGNELHNVYSSPSIIRMMK
jgi:hypothetical protein